MRKLTAILVLLLIVAAPAAFAEEKHAMSLEELFAMKRLSAPAISPDGNWVAYTVSTPNLKENTSVTDIYLVSTTTGENIRLTSADAGSSGPVWAPDSKQIAFSRGGQIWLIRIDGGEATQLTKVENGADGPVWSPDGTKMLFSTMVKPECGEKCEGKCEGEKNELTAKITAKTTDELLFRHWSVWRTDGLKQHLFIMDVATKECKDLMPTAKYDVPPFPFGGSGDYSFSPCGKHIAFAAKVEKDPAIHTNIDIFLTTPEGAEPKCISDDYNGEDTHPTWSPDGKYIIWGARLRPNFEADQLEMIRYDLATGETVNLTRDYDRNIGEWVFDPTNAESLYFIAANHGRRPLMHFNMADGSIEKLDETGYNTTLSISDDGKKICYQKESLSWPEEAYLYETGAEPKRLTHMNDELLANIEFGKVEDYWFKGAKDDDVQVYIVKPPFFDETKKYPLLHVIHGGPQQEYADLWTFGWNSQAFAAKGVVVALVCFHATPGYGQAFVDAVSKDWGGAPYIDIMKATDFLIGLGFIDENRMAAGGGSYGGTLTDWIATQTDRFKALVSHAGTFNLESMYGATEELWFPEWEMNGPYWVDSTYYDKWSPHHFAKNLKTPMLITHGQQDFRVPVSQSFELFTACRRQGVPARLIYYPDEHHWILQHQNNYYWYSEFVKWLDKYIGPLAK